jgi:hypothetical protein
VGGRWALINAVSNAGVPLAWERIPPNIPGPFPGYSIHDDLRNMVHSGLAPYQALSAGTRVPGEFNKKFVPGADSFGAVQVGNRAGLLLINPLLDWLAPSSATLLPPFPKGLGLDTLRRVSVQDA